jgi:hypothetical protein
MGAAGEWIMPWQKPPAWLYLPHLFDAEVVREGGEASAAAIVAAPRAEASRADHPQGRAAAGSNVGHANGDAARQIRGRGDSPGGQREEEQGAAGRAQAADGNQAVSRAAVKLAAANAHLRRSLRDHQDRVDKRRLAEAMGKDASEAPARTAAERLQALRRRVAERAARSKRAVEEEEPPAAEDVGIVTSGCSAEKLHVSECSAKAPSNEDVKMHLLGERRGAAVVEDGGGRASSCNADVVAAARFAAWHSGASG